MKKKSFTKRLIAIICLVCMLVTMFYVSGPTAQTAKAAEEAQTTAADEELTYLTLKDLGITEGEITETGTKTYTSGWDKTVISFYANIKKDGVRMHLGNRASDGYYRAGFVVHFDSTGTLTITAAYPYTSVPTTNDRLNFDAVTVSPSDYGFGDSFLNQKLLYELKTEFVDDDIHFTLMISKKTVASIVIKDQLQKMGNAFRICDGNMELYNYKEVAYTEVKNYDAWTYSEVGGTDGTLSGSASTHDAGGSLHETYFQAKMTFPEGDFGRLYIGRGSYYGIFIEDGTQNTDKGLKLTLVSTYSGQSMGKAIGTITEAIAGNLRGEELNLGISIKFVDVNTSAQSGKLQIGIWLDGVLYNTSYFTTVETKLTDYTKRIRTQNIKNVSITSVASPKKAIPDDYTRYTVSDIAPNEAGINSFLPCDSLDKVVYSTWIKGAEKNAQYHYASNSTSHNYAGFTLNLTSDSAMQLINQQVAITGFVTMTGILAEDTIGAGKTYSEEFLLQYTTEYVDCDFDGDKDDLKFGLWFNGKLYRNQYFYYIGAVPDLGTRVNANSTSASFDSYYEKLPTYTNNYAEWTFEDAGLATGTKSGNWFQSQTTTVEGLDQRLFHGYVTLDGSKQRLFIGHTSKYQGIGFISTGGNLQFGVTSGTDAMTPADTFTPADCGLDSFLGSKIKLSLVTRFVEVASQTDNGDGTVTTNIVVEVIPLVNGKMPKGKIYTFTINNMNFMRQVTVGTNGTMVLENVECTTKPDALPSGLTVVNMNDLGLEDTVTDWKGTGHYDKGSFDDTIIPLTVNFGTGNGQIRWGQQTGVSSYLGILLMKDGDSIKIGASTTNAYKDVFQTPLGGLGITVTPASVSMSTFINVDIDIDLVTQYIDADYDGVDDDLKYGVYINDVLVNGKYNIAKNVVPYLGAGFNVHNDGGTIKKITTNGVTIKTLDESKYDNYTLKDVGIKDGKHSTYGKIRDVDGNEIKGANFDKILFGAKVKFNTVGARMHYSAMSTSQFSGMQVRLLSDGNLTIEDYDGKNLVYDTIIVNAADYVTSGTFKGEEFLLQWTTDIRNLDREAEANDVLMGLWINGKLVNNRYIMLLNSASNLDCYVNFNEGADTEYYSLWNISAPANKDTIYYKMDATHPYLVIADSMKHLTSNKTYLNGEEVSVSGDYTATYAEKDDLQAATQSIVLWKEWDVSADGEYNVKDIIALKKVEKGIELSTEAGQMAASKLDSASTLQEFRQYLVGKVTKLSSSVAAISYDTDADGMVMPIGAWIAPSNWNGYNNAGSLIYMTDFGMETNFLQKKYYNMIQELGINLLTYNADDYNNNAQYSILQSLAFAEQYNLKAYVQDSGVADNITSKSDLAKRLNLYSRYSSFAGLSVYDEPKTEDFYYGSNVDADSHKYMKDIAPKAMLLNTYSNLSGYVNLYPDFHSYREGTVYKNYLNDYITKCNPKELAFDDYPFSTGESVEDSEHYFNNLKLIRQYATDANIPFIGYIGTGEDYTQNVISTSNTLPTNEQLKWNVNTLLAYGAKGYNWFTLIQPWYMAMTGTDGNFTGMDFNRLGLIGADGSKTRHYDTAKEVNAWVAKIDSILMEAESVDILAKGTYAQRNTNISKTTYSDMTLNVGDNTYGAIVGVFNYHGKTAYYIVNNNVSTSQTITLGFSANKNLMVYNGNNKTTQSTNSCALSIEAGGAALVVVE